MVLGIELTSSEIEEILYTKYFATSPTGYTPPTGLYALSDLSWIIKSLLPDDENVDITIDDFRLRSKLTTGEITN